MNLGIHKKVAGNDLTQFSESKMGLLKSAFCLNDRH